MAKSILKKYDFHTTEDLWDKEESFNSAADILREKINQAEQNTTIKLEADNPKIAHAIRMSLRQEKDKRIKITVINSANREQVQQIANYLNQWLASNGGIVFNLDHPRLEEVVERVLDKKLSASEQKFLAEGSG